MLQTRVVDVGLGKERFRMRMESCRLSNFATKYEKACVCFAIYVIALTTRHLHTVQIYMPREEEELHPVNDSDHPLVTKLPD